MMCVNLIPRQVDLGIRQVDLGMRLGIRLVIYVSHSMRWGHWLV